jgi:hypothetical protein
MHRLTAQIKPAPKPATIRFAKYRFSPILSPVKEINIRKILDDWPYEPEQAIRMVRFPDGRLLLQVRLPMGLEQYEVKGRPDGKKPHDMETALAFHKARFEKAVQAGIEGAFRLDHAACEELFDESTLFYLRYIRFLEIEDWERTLADTEHNLALFDVVARYAEKPDDQLHLEQWRPYLIRVHALAGAMIQMKKRKPDKALQLLQEAVDRIKALPVLEFESYSQELRHSLSELNALLRRIRDKAPPNPAAALEAEPQLAIRKEDYERAAVLRDEISSLRSGRGRRKTAP